MEAILIDRFSNTMRRYIPSIYNTNGQSVMPRLLSYNSSFFLHVRDNIYIEESVVCV